MNIAFLTEEPPAQNQLPPPPASSNQLPQPSDAPPSRTTLQSRTRMPLALPPIQLPLTSSNQPPQLHGAQSSRTTLPSRTRNTGNRNSSRPYSTDSRPYRQVSIQQTATGVPYGGLQSRNMNPMSRLRGVNAITVPNMVRGMEAAQYAEATRRVQRNALVALDLYMDAQEHPMPLLGLARSLVFGVPQIITDFLNDPGVGVTHKRHLASALANLARFNP